MTPPGMWSPGSPSAADIWSSDAQGGLFRVVEELVQVGGGFSVGAKGTPQGAEATGVTCLSAGPALTGTLS